MLEKFAREDKIEQMAQQKRRMKEVQHKREIERLWQEKLNAFREQKEQEYQEYQRVVNDQRWEQQVIEREKERLLKEHLANLDGFMPKEIAKMSNAFSNTAQRTNYSQGYRM